MKYPSGFVALLFLATCAFSQAVSVAQGQQPASADHTGGSSKAKKSKPGTDSKPASTATPSAQDSSLEAVLSQMDAAASSFRIAEADVTTEDYQKVVDDHHTDKGKIYLRKTARGVNMAMDFTSSPDSKYVILIDSKVRIYQPKVDQVTEYTIASSSADVQGMFALGFGGRGHDLLESFDAKLVGSEMIDGDNVNRLELTPKTQGIRKYFSRVELWFDPAKKVPLQQQFWQPSGDYHLAHYSNIKTNQKLPEDVFKIKTTSHTKVVTP